MKGNTYRQGKRPTNAWTSDDLKGKKNPRWTGDNVTYGGIHDWMTYNYGQPKKCEQCGSKNENTRYHWANISGEYKRDRSDWVRLCPKCHYKYDGRVLYKYQKRKIREIMSNNQSGFKNVYQTKSGKYCSYISVNGKQVKLGYTFKTAEEAYEAYKRKAIELYGEY